MSDNIPFDIQMEIIKRVPDVKSLIRFRAVSKPWKSFIENSKFITGYGVRHTQPHRLLLRYTDNVDPYEVKYVSFVDDENDILTQQQDFAPNVTDLVKQLKYSTVIGSSCGLWCLHGYNSSKTEMVVIWNPSIRKSVGIVVPCELNSTSRKLTHFGFGVCPSTYDPTIVGISRYLTKFKHKVVGIFTLSSNTWKMIPSSNMPCESIKLRSATQVAIDRFIFWVAFDRIVNLILSFDLITHEFKEVNLLVSIAKAASDISISKLNESLVVSAYTYEVNGQVYGVWMMGEEGGVMTSFTKLFTIKTPDDLYICKVLGFTMSGEPIIETQKDNGEFATVEVCKPCSEHINDLGINGEIDSFFICHYTETLLLINHSDCCNILAMVFESLRGGFPSRWESVGFCPIDASIRGWQGLPSG
ncbi:F-box protein-like protein, partial [Tanacetum coccineum]